MVVLARNRFSIVCVSSKQMCPHRVLVLNDDGVGFEHLADGRLSLDDGEVVKPLVVQLVDSRRIRLGHVLAKRVPCSALCVFAEVVVRKLGRVPQQGLVQFSQI